MNETMIKEIQTSLEKSIPEIVAATMEAKNAENATQMKSIEDALTEIKANYNLLGNKKEVVREELIKNTGTFFKSLKKFGGRVESVPAEVKATFLNEATDAEGGFMVPNDFAKEILYVAGNYGVARKYCHIIPMGSDTKDITKITAGVTVYWTAEGAAYTKSKPTYAQVRLVAKKLTALVGATMELIEDNMTDEEVFTQITRLIGEAFAKFEDNQVFNGDGTGDNFLGITADSNVNVITAGAVSYAKLVLMLTAVNGMYLRNGANVKWFMNRTTWGSVLSLVDGQSRPLISTDIAGKPFGTLFGYDVEMVDDLATGTVVFGDLYNYAFGDRRGISIDIGYASGDWEKDIQSIKANERIAGKIKFPTAFAVLEAS